MKKARADKADAQKPLNREELQLVTARELAFPFIQQAMQGATSPVEPT